MSTQKKLAAIVMFGFATLGSGVSARQPSVSLADTAHKTVELRRLGLQLGYDLDHEAALAAFEKAIQTSPDDPAAYRLAAATAWISLLFQRGAVTAEDYLGQVRSGAPREPPSSQEAAFFRERLSRAVTLAEAKCRDAGNSADAHFQLGAAYGFQASYAATVEGSVFDSLKAARRAYNEHQRVLDIDPSRKDAGLIVGMYRYGVSTLSLPGRIAAHLVGFGGGRERGIRMVEDAARYPSDVQTNARFSLIVIYNREARYGDALRVIADLQRQYPRNRLLWLEAGSTALRAGRPAEARASLEAGLAKLADDSRPHAFGEMARWRYYYGATLVALKDAERAGPELQSALSEPGRDWVKGRIHVELGKLADLAGQRTQAIDEYRAAVRLCSGDHDDACERDARELMKRRAS
jgi:tetratricopeptide (TPR) repeat protein